MTVEGGVQKPKSGTVLCYDALVEALTYIPPNRMTQQKLQCIVTVSIQQLTRNIVDKTMGTLNTA